MTATERLYKFAA